MWGKKRFKYPRFSLLILVYILVYFIFTQLDLAAIHNTLTSTGFIAPFIAGIFYAYGFTAAAASAFFLVMATGQNLILSGLIGGLGSLVADLIIFRFIRHSFHDEIERLADSRYIKIILAKLHPTFKKYLALILGIIFIASPLPDELGVTILAGTSNVSPRLFSALSYSLNTLGIMIILFIGSRI